MCNHYIFTFLLGLFTISFYGQSYEISGVVTDNLTNTLPYTNILAKPISSEIEMAFAITDEQGRYKLELKKNELYTVTVSYLGFQPVNFEIKLTENVIKNIQLQPATNQLEEVIVIQKQPVIVKQDTIVYNTKVFTTGTERKLKQILKKLPGVEVDKNGSVTVLGKKVTKLLVDGKTFFGGGTKLGVENIPANAVDAVEVLDNYNEVTFLKDLSDSDKLAMNIILKKDKKQFAFGDIEAGAGSDEHYLVHPNLFYYSPKTNVNFIADINDIGVKSFTLQDYLNFEGGMGKLFSDPSSYFRLSNNEFAGFLQNQDFIASQNKFGAFNITQTISNKIDLSSYVIFSNTKYTTRNETTNQFIAQDIQTTENRLAKGSANDTFVMAKVSLDYLPSTSDDISYSGFFKSAMNAHKNTIETSTPITTNNINTFINTDAVTIKQNAEWHKKLSRKHTTSLTVNYLYDKSEPTTNWITDLPILQGLIPLVDDTNFDINQIKELQINKLDILFRHYWVLNNSNHIYTTIGNHYLYENYKTDEFQQLTNGTVNNFNASGFGNDLDFQINDFYLGIQHKFRAGIVTVKSGISAHQYTWQVNQSTRIKNDKIIWLPNFITKIDFSRSEHLNFRYNLKSSFADGTKYANQFQLVRYNAVSRGNETLENELYHTARLWYTKFSLYRGIIMSGSVSFNKKVKSIRNQIQLQGIDRFSSPVLTNNPETTWSFNTNLRKRLGKLSVKLKSNLKFSDYLQEVNSLTSKNKSSTQGFGVELSTNFKKLPNIEIGYNRSFSKFLSASTTSNFSNEEPYFSIDYDFLKGFILSADYSRNNYRDNIGQKNRYEIANASLFYQKEDSAWGFKISGTNILGVDFKNRNSFSDFIISDSKTFILPRIWLFTITYKI
jgi:hypothetical protein